MCIVLVYYHSIPIGHPNRQFGVPICGEGGQEARGAHVAL